MRIPRNRFSVFVATWRLIQFQLACVIQRAAVTEQLRAGQSNWTWNGPDVPTVKPSWLNFQVADDGRIWVALELPRDGSTPATSPARNGVYDVFEPVGTYIGRVSVPSNIVMFTRRGDKVWGVEMGKDDIPRVVRYRITWS